MAICGVGDQKKSPPTNYLEFGQSDIYPFSAGIDFRRQILTSKVGPRAKRVNVLSDQDVRIWNLNKWFERIAKLKTYHLTFWDVMVFNIMLKRKLSFTP